MNWFGRYRLLMIGLAASAVGAFICSIANYIYGLIFGGHYGVHFSGGDGQRHPKRDFKILRWLSL